MEASINARKILRQVLKLEDQQDIQFVIDRSTDFLSLFQDSAVDENYDFGDNAEDFQIEAANSLFFDTSIDLSGPEIVLLSCFLLTVETEVESFTTRQVSKAVARARSVANMSATMEGLVAKAQLEMSVPPTGGHRLYELTKLGLKDSEQLIQAHSKNRLKVVREA